MTIELKAKNLSTLLNDAHATADTLADLLEGERGREAFLRAMRARSIERQLKILKRASERLEAETTP